VGSKRGEFGRAGNGKSGVGEEKVGRGERRGVLGGVMGGKGGGGGIKRKIGEVGEGRVMLEGKREQ